MSDEEYRLTGLELAIIIETTRREERLSLSWITPAFVLALSIMTLIVCDFRDSFGLKGDFIQGFYLAFVFVSLILTIKGLVAALGVWVGRGDDDNC